MSYGEPSAIGPALRNYLRQPVRAPAPFMGRRMTAMTFADPVRLEAPLDRL